MTESQQEWEDVEIPRGAYISWGNQPGQCVAGKVIDYDAAGGTDFNGEQCPSLELELIEPADSFNKEGQRSTFEAGETVQLNCGQVSLKRGVRKAALQPGDRVRITLVNLARSARGRVKEFALQVARSTQSDFGDDEPRF
jgi:hypothetical protein